MQCLKLSAGLMLAGFVLIANGSNAGAADDNPRDSSVKPVVTTLEERFAHVDMEAKKMADVAVIGERLKYAIKWKGVPAGEAIFSVKRLTSLQGQKAYYLTFETQSNDAISMLYPVRDKVKSYVDAETGYSLLFARNMREGSYRADDTLQFDYEKNLQYYSSIKYDDDETSEKVKPPRPIPGPLQDPLSILYYLRHFPMSSGEEKRVVVGTRKKTGILLVKVEKEEEITLPGVGVFDANLVKLGAEDGEEYEAEIFVSKGDIRIWVEKHTNIPLIVQVGLPILGHADAVLYSAENTALNDHIKRKSE